MCPAHSIGHPASIAPLWLRKRTAVWLRSVTLPITAAMTLTFSSPGLWLLLSVFDEQLQAVAKAVARTYLRGGLLCFGFTPTLLLYAARERTPLTIGSLLG